MFHLNSICFPHFLAFLYSCCTLTGKLVFTVFYHVTNLQLMNFKKVKYSFIFNRKGRLNEDGTALIQLKAYKNGKSRYFSSGIWIEPTYWDKTNRKVKNNHSICFELNNQLQSHLNSLQSFELKTLKRRKRFQLADFDNLFNNKKEIETFSDFYLLELQLATITKGSIKNQRTTFHKLNDFQKVIYFEDLTYKFVVDFDRFLRKQGLSDNTIAKHASNVQVYINKAIKQRYLKEEDNPYKVFRVKKVEPERIHLSAIELEKIESLIFSEENQHLELIRDAYLTCVYTGLRFGDMVKLSKQNISKTKKGLELRFTANKTLKPLVMPLYLMFKEDGKKKSKAEKIILKHLKKRKRLYQGTNAFDKLPFFKLSNQYFNRSLKEIAQLAGIDKHISSHSARRTFATVMARKVKAPVLQKMLQHSSIGMTNAYIRLSNRDLEDELQKIEW